ncbi:MAG: type 3 dihydrofolate reductase [Candidatus Promineifilaceae bacterium]
MIISLIAALDKNNLIGANDELPWHLPDDLRWYFRNTKRKTIVMGRKTFDSMGGKPMKRRVNIVMTRQTEFEADGCQVVNSVEAAIEAAGEIDELMIIGGSYIYALFLPLANRFYLTRVDGTFEGDTYFPAFDLAEWDQTYHQHHAIDEKHAHTFNLYILDRKQSVNRG